MARGSKMLVRVLIAIVLVGCATGYKKEGYFTGGFRETRLGENIFQVRFSGNQYTSSERAQDFTLLRCAELAKLNGFTHFVIVEGQSLTSQRTYKSPTKTKVNATVAGNSVYGKATTTGGQTYTISSPTRSNTIVCFRGQPKQYALSYESNYIINAIKQKWGIDGSRIEASRGIRSTSDTGAFTFPESKARARPISKPTPPKAELPASPSKSILGSMSVSSFRSIGLRLLTDSEMANLDKWLGTVMPGKRPVKMLDSMSMSTFRSTGLGKLSERQLDHLDDWLSTLQNPKVVSPQSVVVSPATVRKLARSDDWMDLKLKDGRRLKCKIIYLKDSGDPLIKVNVETGQGGGNSEWIATTDIASIGQIP